MVFKITPSAFQAYYRTQETRLRKYLKQYPIELDGGEEFNLFKYEVQHESTQLEKFMRRANRQHILTRNIKNRKQLVEEFDILNPVQIRDIHYTAVIAWSKDREVRENVLHNFNKRNVSSQDVIDHIRDHYNPMHIHAFSFVDPQYGTIRVVEYDNFDRIINIVNRRQNAIKFDPMNYGANFKHHSFGQEIDNDNTLENKNCVYTFFMGQYLHFKKCKRENFSPEFMNDIKQFEQSKDVRLGQIVEICKQHQIQIQFYNALGEVFLQSIENDNNEQQSIEVPSYARKDGLSGDLKYKKKGIKINCLVYDNHIYFVRQDKNTKSSILSKLKFDIQKMVRQIDHFKGITISEYNEHIDTQHHLIGIVPSLQRLNIKHFIMNEIVHYVSDEQNMVDQIIKMRKSQGIMRLLDLNPCNFFSELLKFKNIELKKSLIFHLAHHNAALVQYYKNFEGSALCIDKNHAYQYYFSKLTKLTFINQLIHKQLLIDDIDNAPNASFVFCELKYKLNQQEYILPPQWYHTRQLRYWATRIDMIVGEIYQCFECEEYDNPMINNEYNTIQELHKEAISKNCRDLFKLAINSYLGKSQKQLNNTPIDNTRFYRIVKEDSLSIIKDCQYSVFDEEKKLYLVQKKNASATHTRTNIKTENNITLSWQVISRTTLEIIFKAQQLQNKYGCEILGIKTDCIYISSEYEGQILENEQFQQKEVFDGWKCEQDNITLQEKLMHSRGITQGMVEVNASSQFIKIHNRYPGVGKTYEIKQKMMEQDENCRFVIGPSYSTIQEYEVKTCHVLQLLMCNLHQLESGNEVYVKKIGQPLNILFENIDKSNKPYIYIDEIFLCETAIYSMMYRIKTMYKNIEFHAFGDSSQLLAVGSYEIGKIFIDKCVSVISQPDDIKNWRNDFTFQEYDKLKGVHSSSRVQKILYEVYKTLTPIQFDTKWNIPEIIDLMNDDCYSACLTNENRKDLYKSFIVKVKECRTMINNQYFIGQRIYCNSNFEHEKEQLYNKQLFHITEFDNRRQIIKVQRKCDQIIIELSFKKFESHFEQSQFVTIHYLQGQGCRIHISEQIFKSLCNTDRAIYTVFSRSNVHLNDKQKLRVQQLIAQI